VPEFSAGEIARMAQTNGKSQKSPKDAPKGKKGAGGKKNLSLVQPETVLHIPSLREEPHHRYQTWGYAEARFSVADADLNNDLASIRVRLGNGEIVELELKIKQLAALESAITRYLNTPE
jgi:hypothetical protein